MNTMNEALKDADNKNNIVGGVDTKKLNSVIERIERLQNERTDVNVEIRGIFSEAKECGLNKPAIKEVLKLRKLEPAVRDEFEVTLEQYKKAAGV